MAWRPPPLKLSRRERRLIGVALLAIVVFFTFDHIADALYYWPQRTRDRLFHERNKLERSQLKLQASPRLQARVAANREALARLNRRLLPGDKPPVAAARLQRIIEQVAETVNIEIKSQKINRPIEHASMLEVPVEVAFFCNVGELMNFLYRIESHARLLTIPKWSIRVPNHRDPKKVQVNLTITGFIKKA